MKRINAKLFADMWLSEAITDEQRELAARVAKSAMEFPEDKTDIEKFIEKRIKETTGPEHHYLEKLIRDHKETQITHQAITITQPERCLIYGGVCCYPIEACSECPKHYENAQPNVHDLPKDADCISRQAAIDAFDKRFDSIPIEQTTEALLLRKDLRQLPPAQPQRTRGKWIDTDNYYRRWKCSECGCHTKEARPEFCPHCGADMREEQIDERY